MSMLEICFRDANIGPIGQPIFRHFSWTVEPFQSWIITGSNGSGKSALAQALAGGLPVTSRGASPLGARQLPAPETVALISFERQRDVVFDERYHDDSEFVEGGVDPGTAARDFILRRGRGAASIDAPARLAELVQRLGIGPLMDRGLKYLSTGEIRKVLLCRELLREPALLIFDEPYEGLDTATRAVLAQEIQRLVSASLQPSSGKAPSRVLLISDRYEHVPDSTTHVLHLEDRSVAFAGTRAAFEARGVPLGLQRLGASETATLSQALADTLEDGARASDSDSTSNSSDVLVRLRAVTVSYGGRLVLDRVSLNVRRAEHTLVRGPNGCGKTTLLNLITGDNPQVYANDVTVCGMKRGSGESIWDVKAKLGQVSYALHVEYAYRCQANLIETVLSGFYDSIGLYREPGFAEIRSAERWLGVVGLLDKRAQPFTQLSYGEQRVALILRAVIKQPPLLILDEPCHGLDPRHRSEVLTIADYIGQSTDSTLLYVTHDPEEQLACTQQVFELSPEHGWQLSSVHGRHSPTLEAGA